MKNIRKLGIIIISCGLLSACLNIQINGDKNDASEKQVEKDKTSSDKIPDNNIVEKEEIVSQNDAFQVFEPVPNSVVKGFIVVRGLARVFEAHFQYEFVDDQQQILNQGYTMASEGAPGWGEFEFIIELDDSTISSGTVVLFEGSPKDGSRTHELKIPVTIKD